MDKKKVYKNMIFMYQMTPMGLDTVCIHTEQGAPGQTQIQKKKHTDVKARMDSLRGIRRLIIQQ